MKGGSARFAACLEGESLELAHVLFVLEEHSVAAGDELVGAAPALDFGSDILDQLLPVALTQRIGPTFSTAP
jgi:hypothetical protein